MSGKKLLKSMLICCVAILGILALRPSEVRASALGTECRPIEIEICTICGKDYNNPEACPHHKGDVYNGTVCSPDEGLMCAVCHGEWYSCPHTNGETYGGILCTTYRKCDICGNNYDDANSCPHHEGEAYGGTECSTYTILICNICGNNYENGEICSHVNGMVYEEGECVPFDRRICTICGNDYDNGGVCPHHIGEYYDQRVCTITRICRICGGNYDDGSECPHHEGERYGGETCTPYEGLICNICAHDYNMGEVCPHHVGEMYNGQVCETYIYRRCNLCYCNYDSSTCKHQEGQSYFFNGNDPFNDFVISIAYGGTIGAGASVGFYDGFAFDEEGNAAKLHSAAGNIQIGPTASVCLQIQITNAKSLDKFSGFGESVGGSVGVGVGVLSVGTGIDIIQDINEEWAGVSISFQVGANTPGLINAELHGGITYTLINEINVASVDMKDITDKIKIMYSLLSGEQIRIINAYLGQQVL